MPAAATSIFQGTSSSGAYSGIQESELEVQAV